MSGRADYPSTTIANENVIVYGNNNKWVKASEPIDNSFEQVDSVSNDGGAEKYSPSASFAEKVESQNSGKRIILIPCAKGDTSILEWQRNLSTGTLYGSMLNRINTVTGSGTNPLSGIIMIQGENDSLNSTDANLWASRFTQFVTDIRSDLGYAIKIFFVKLGDIPSPPTYWNVVRTQQESISISGVYMVDVDDIWDDAIHFDTSRATAIGERIGDEYLSS